VSDPWVVFDLIGVLAGPSWRAIAPEAADAWRSFKLGERPEAAFWDEGRAAAYREALSFHADGLALVRRLKQRGYRVCLATNFSAAWLDHLLAKAGARGLFDARVVSAEVKVAKPDAAFWDHVLRHAPRGSIFVDDQRNNCEAAARAGLEAIWAAPGGGAFEEVERRSLESSGDAPGA
jgi:HAD superfamily hydrolase (TIGR01509 family)